MAYKMSDCIVHENPVMVTDLPMWRQKRLALSMWRYIRKWYEKHPHEFMSAWRLKGTWCYKQYTEKNISIDWSCECILCDRYYCNRCKGCPLRTRGKPRICVDFNKLDDPEYPKHLRVGICDKIINAIEEFNK